MPEKRCQPRRSVDVEFRSRQVKAALGTLTFGSRDLSVDGAFLKAEVLLEQGERLWLELTLPGRATPVRAEARVAWVRRLPGAGQEGGMGVEFLGMTEADRRALRDFVENDG